MEENMFLAQNGGLILGPIAKLLGWILNILYNALNGIGVVNIGVAIILFTIVIRLCLLPPQIKQNKSTKVMNYIQPEINKINKKYKGRKDQDSMLKQQQEVRELQNKYGVNLTTGCLTSLIQMPIFLAMYRVMQNIPAYVSKVHDYYSPIATAIKTDSKAVETFTKFFSSEENGYSSILRSYKIDANDVESFVDILAKLPAEGWDKLKDAFTGSPEVVNAINDNAGTIKHIYSFIGGIDLTKAPGLVLSSAIAIPILSMVFQFLSMKVTPQQGSDDPAQQATMKTMKTMLYFFPIMSFMVTVNVPAGLGLYWATGALLSFLTTLCVNIYFKHCDMEKVVEKCKEKAAIKNEKRKASGKKSFMERMQEAALGQTDDGSNKVNSTAAKANLKSYSSSTMSNNNSGKKYREGSLAAKANIMQKYNDK